MQFSQRSKHSCLTEELRNDFGPVIEGTLARRPLIFQKPKSKKYSKTCESFLLEYVQDAFTL